MIIRNSNYLKYYGVLITISWLGTWLNGQSISNVQYIETAQVTSFTREEGLPICLGEMFQVPEGRTYITTCGPEHAEANSFLYEYDGKKSRLIPFHHVLGNTNAIPSYQGMNSQGFLYGYFYNTGDLKTSIFAFNPVSYQLQMHTLEPQSPTFKIINVIWQESFGYAVFGVDKDYNFLFKLIDDQLKLVAKVKKLDKTAEVNNYDIDPLLIENEEAFWFWEGINAPAFRWEKASGQIDTFDYHYFSRLIGPNINEIKFYEGHNGIVITNVFSEQGSEYTTNLFAYNREKSTFDLLDIQSQMINQYGLFNGKVFFDEVGNMLFIPNEFEGGKALLFEKENGKVFDYSIVGKAVFERLSQPRAWITTVGSKDFRKNACFLGGGGISFVELKSVEAFQVYPTVGTRAMVELTPQKILIKTEETSRFFILETDTRRLVPNPRPWCNYNVRAQNLGDLYADQEGNIFLSIYEQHLLKYDPDTDECDTFNIGKDFEHFIHLSKDNILLSDKITGECYFFDLTTRERRPFLIDEQIFSFGSTVFQIKQTSDGIIWGATTNGLWRIDIQNQQVLKPHDHLPFQQDQIYYIDEAENGDLWLGTGNDGVNIYNPQTGGLKVIDESKGLSNNTAIGILKDEAGIRWVNTYNGINLILPNGTFLTKIFEEDGLANGEGNRFSSYKTSDEKLIFGSVDGLTIIDPMLAKQQLFLNDSIKIFLTEVSFFDKKNKKDTTIQSDLNRAYSLILPATRRYLRLHFALSDFRELEENNFDYRFEQVGTKDTSSWIFLGNQNELNLTNLPVGKYDLVIRGKNFRGQQAANLIKVSIEVREYFYKTWWFYLLCALPILTVAWIWIQRIFTERQRLKIEVDRRTEQIRKDKETIQSQAEALKKLDEAKSRFFADISHELRTPLTIILGMAEQINKQPQEWAAEGSNMIKKSGSNLLDLVHQILELQKLESGELKMNMENGDIIPFIHDIFEQFKALADSKELSLQFISSVTHLTMDYDREKVLRILSNLLSNAIKFTPPDGVVMLSLSKENTPSVQSQECLKLMVKDSGQGVPDEQLPLLFDRYFQSSLNDQEKVGTGIGLSLTKELVTLLGGKIEVESKLNYGTTFRVFLPITNNAQASGNEDHLEIQRAVFGTRKFEPNEQMANSNLPTVLIVEDNPDIAQYLQLCLRNNYELELASNGQKGIDRALDIIPDIIVSDVMMPEKDGFELCETLKQDIRSSHIPIVLLTAKSDVSSRIQGLKYGADDYLAKPFNEEELLVRMENLLNIRQKLQARYQDVYAKPIKASKAQKPVLEDEFMLKLKVLFDKRMDDPKFELNELSKALFLSRSQLGRKVKALTGKSLSNYLKSLRLQKARQLILTTDYSITKVALEVGISNISYFSRLYSEEFGETPSSTGT